MRFLRRLFCRHKWTMTLVNVEVHSGNCGMLTLCSYHCEKCGHCKLEFIFPNGGPKP